MNFESKFRLSLHFWAYQYAINPGNKLDLTLLMLALEPGWKSFLFMNLANILLFTNRFLANRAINEKHPMLRVRHLEFRARKGKWDTFLLLVPGPLDLVEEQHVAFLPCSRFWHLRRVAGQEEIWMWSPCGRCSVGSSERSWGKYLTKSRAIQHRQRNGKNWLELCEVHGILWTRASMECRMEEIRVGKAALRSKQWHRGSCAHVL